MIERDLKLIQPGEVRVRIAPSPTGALHVGTARTALFNYLFAKQNKGSFVLRIEDTDLERSNPKWEKDIMENLKWLGIEWSEGPDIGGPYGPYRQSERKEIYKKYIQKLLDERKIYSCFCSQEELEAERQYLMSIGKPPRYSGKCRGLSSEEIRRKMKEGKSFVLRLKTPVKKVVFEDMLRGKIAYNTEVFDDIVVAKDISTPLYNLACVIDDFEMKISYIIRGEDHIPNTPKQLLIADALDIKPPKYLHLSLILGQNREKLSKRHGATSIAEYKEMGYLPEALVNFMVLLGWNPDTEKEIFSMSALIKEFSLSKLQKSGAVFNIQKLDWLNGFYIRHKPLDRLTELCIPYLVQAGLIAPAWSQKETAPLVYSTPPEIIEFEICSTKEKINFDSLKNIVSLYQERLKRLSEIPELSDFFFKKHLDYPKELLKWKDATEKETKDMLDKLRKILSHVKNEDWTKENLENVLIKEAEKAALSPEMPAGAKMGERGKLLWPLRVALSGKQASAGPFEIAAVLGKEKTLERIKEARKKL